MYDLSGLSPQEKDEIILEMLAQQQGHQDAPQDAAMLQPLVQAIEMLTNRVEELERLVLDDLFGGIEKLYNENKRKTGIEGLRSKYGELFQPHLPVLEELEPGADVFEKIYDLLGDVGEEERDSKVQGYASTLAEKIAKIRGANPDLKSVEVEVTSAEPALEAEAPAENSFLESVKRMAKKAK